MSKSIPYFDFYPADFMHGVRGLTPAEVGVYTMLLCRIYEENGPVEYHVARLATYCGMREPAFEKTFERLVDLGKISLASGLFSNGRAQQEIASRETKLKNNSRAGKISAEKRQQKQSRDATDVQRDVNHTDTDTDKNRVTDVTPCPIAETRGPSFDQFWAEWPLGKIGKEAARKAFGRLSADHRADATANAREWAIGWRQANPRLSDIHPATFLNNKRWQDEGPAQPALTVINGGTYVQSPRPNRADANADALRYALDVAGRSRPAPEPDWLQG